MITLATDLPLLLPITALLPLTAILLVAQTNPYQTLVLRGILGAVAALI
jgi:putative multicomponent Na+:H+ antiporter subunit B